MVKVVTLFVIFIAVLAIFGRLRLPKIGNPLRRQKIKTAQKCPSCGAYQFEGITCTCKPKSKKK